MKLDYKTHTVTATALEIEDMGDVAARLRIIFPKQNWVLVVVPDPATSA